MKSTIKSLVCYILTYNIQGINQLVMYNTQQLQQQQQQQQQQLFICTLKTKLYLIIFLKKYYLE